MSARSLSLSGRVLSIITSRTASSRCQRVQACRAFHVTSTRTQNVPEESSHDSSSVDELSKQTRKSPGSPVLRIDVDLYGKSRNFSSLFLRDACRCSKCVDPSTQQKLFQTADIPHNVKAVRQPTSTKDVLRFSWINDHPATTGEEHVTGLSAVWLDEAHEKSHHLATTRAPLRERTIWDRQRMETDNLWVDYEQYASSDDILLQTLRQLQTHGLVFLRNVPDDETSVVSIAERIGPLRDTFYGRTWDVRSVPNAKNIAYTNQYLGLHMDLLYMTNPPHLQLLHSLRAKAPGGESLFSDSFHAAESIRKHHPDLFFALSQQQVTYHYKNASQHYEATRPTVELELAGIVGGQGGVSTAKSLFGNVDTPPKLSRIPHCTSAISRINWSPPFQAPFQQDIADLKLYHHGARTFSELVNAPENVFEYRLAEGECVIFDNRRVLHARKAFDPSGGERWLKGAYVDDDAYWSRLRVLEEAAANGPAS